MKRLIPLATALVLVLPTVVFAAPQGFDAQQREQVIRAAYSRLQSYTATSELPFEVVVDEFETLRPSQFDRVDYLDLVTMPEGHVIQMTRSTQTNQSLGETRVAYLPEWQQKDAEWAAAPEADRLAGMSVAEIFAEVAANNSDYEHIRAVTAYTVTARLGGAVRTYRAAFLWVPERAQDGYQSAFIVVDNVVQGVEEAIRDSYAPLVSDDFLQIVGDIERPEGATKASCSSWSNAQNRSYSANSSSSHIWGEHRSSASFRITCSCNSICDSSCTAEIPSYSCSDSGFTADACHKMGSAVDASSDTRYGGGAACAAGLGCAQRSCLYCLCGLSVSASANGASVSFSASGANWTGHLKYTRTCGPC